MREDVERLTAIRDWAGAFVAAAVVFEPLVGELSCSEFIRQVVAPVILESARKVQPIWSQPGEKVIRVEESLEHSHKRHEEILADLNLDAKELA